jgi:hypothetical protein
MKYGQYGPTSLPSPSPSPPLPSPRCRTSGHLLERIPLRTTSTRIYVAPPAHVTAPAVVDQRGRGRGEGRGYEIARGRRAR